MEHKCGGYRRTLGWPPRRGPRLHRDHDHDHGPFTEPRGEARDYIGKGDAFYRKAAEEILAAKAEGVTVAAIARELGYSRGWVTDLVAWATECHGHAPFGGPRREAVQSKSRAKKFLTRSTPEQVRAGRHFAPEKRCHIGVTADP